jgi:uncharacterized iron-regulated membrane protein
MVNWRKLHRKIAPLLFLPLAIAALTGIAYRLSRNWFQLSGESTEFLIALHTGRYLGDSLVPFYVLLVGLGLLGIIATGTTMLLKRSSDRDLRPLHRRMAIAAMLPLFVTAITGMGFQFGQSWWNWPQEATALLLRLHQGSYLGPVLKVWYVLGVGIALLILLATGIYLTGIGRRRRRPIAQDPTTPEQP